MAGLDDGFTGEARLTPGFTVGYLSQEPQLDPAKDVKGNVMDGVREVQALLDAVQRRDGEVVGAGRRLRGDRRRAERARGPDQRRRRLERRAQRRDRDGGAALPARRRRRHDALGRREAPRRARPAAAPAPRPAPARRADQPPRRRVRRVAGALPRRVRRARSSPSPTTATSSTTSRSGSSSSTAAGACRSRATTRAGWSRSSSGMSREQKQADARQRTLARELEWVRMGAKARQAKGKARLSAYEKLLAEANDAKGTESRARDRDPARSAPRRHRSSRSRTCARATATGC